MGLYGDNDRLLTPKEETLIRRVFKDAPLPPMSHIFIRDGLSPTGTAITIRDGNDFNIMAGLSLFAGDLADDEPTTLVHEMTHVWQYNLGTLTKTHGAIAQAHSWVKGKLGLGIRPGNGDLYSYDLGGTWNDFGFEGQAQLVEDWFSPMDGEHPDGNNMQESVYGEMLDRFVYISKVLRTGDPIARELTLAELRTPGDPPEPSALTPQERTIAFNNPPPFSDAYLMGVLRQRILPGDTRGQAARVKKLDLYFRQLHHFRRAESVHLGQRFDASKPPPKDTLARAFQYALHPVTQRRLLAILRGYDLDDIIPRKRI